MTIKDVAQKAGVSIATVSYVINGTKNVKEKTRERVLEAIRECGYVPNVAAKSLKARKSNMIGIITPSCRSSYFSGVLRGFEDEADRNGYQVIIVCSNLNVTAERRLVETLSGGMVDGMLILTMLNDSQEIQNLLPGHLPCVLADYHTKENISADTIIHTFEQAIRKAVQYFHQRGHEQIGICLGIEGLTSVQVQKQIFLEALREEGLDPEKSMVLHFSHHSDTPAIIAKAANEGCHAFCFINSNIMRHAFYNARTNEFMLPADCDFVCGYEYEDDFLLNGFPRIDVPTIEIGREAARMLLSRLQADAQDVPFRKVCLPCQFVPS